MARHYHIDIARFAARSDAKWTDNLLAAASVPGVDSARRGVSRRISAHGIYHIALIRHLNQDLGVAVQQAVLLAGHLLATDANHIAFPGCLELRLDRRTFQREIDERIADAVESLVPARRGRPPKHRA